ncbi:MAG: histidinol phosphate phosphatase domain-containing protein [Halobacteriota archaeon]
MIDLHTHTVFSDGELIPSELVRRAVTLGYRGIGITDHVDYTNIEHVLTCVKKAKYMEEVMDIRVLAGVELTHVHPAKIAPIAKMAREMGAEIIVVHGESPVEPVAPGTNAAAAACEDVDILAHPGFLTTEEAQMALDNDVCIEITARNGHNRTNGHVARIANEVGATLVVDTDTHSPDNLITKETALKVAIGAGLTESQAKQVLDNSVRFIQ